MCSSVVAAVRGSPRPSRHRVRERRSCSSKKLPLREVSSPAWDCRTSTGSQHSQSDRLWPGLLLELLSKSGVCKPDAKTVMKHNPTIPNTFEFKLLLDQLIHMQGHMFGVLFNSFVCDVETRGDRIASVRVANKDGLVTIQPQVVVDCTGDADVAAWAGAPHEQSKEVQPLTLHFRIGRVKKNADLTTNCRVALQQAEQRGDLPQFYGPGVMFLFGEDEVYVHGVRTAGKSDRRRRPEPGRGAGSSRCPYHVSGLEEVGARIRAILLHRGLPLDRSAAESRRLIGQHVLTEDDLMRSRRFDDAIATGCWYLDLHPNKTTLGSANDFKPEKVQPEPYDIPYRSLLAQKVANLLVAGRCHSATRGAHASTRVTVTAMATGEAAGMAASLAVAEKKSPQEIKGTQVREAECARKGAGPFTDA